MPTRKKAPVKTTRKVRGKGNAFKPMVTNQANIPIAPPQYYTPSVIPNKPKPKSKKGYIVQMMPLG